ncbi:glycosyltransferase family 4 protein [Aquimarina sp. SS2-1]|uniref:glycosyltransferase family 4 protein n=1 Tax=Aquimarina besae TaxID=3342247 RepID=UPI00367074A5
MRLVVDIRLIHNSGIGTYIKNILPGIISSFDEVIVLVNKEGIDEFKWKNRVHVITFPYKTYSFLEQLYYSSVIPECDVFWTPHFNAPLFSIKSKKRIVTIHDVNHMSNPSNFSRIKRLWAKVLYQNAVRKSDYIITVSEFSKSEILRHFKAEKQKLSVVHCGVKQNYGKSINTEDCSLALPKSYFLFVGNVKPHKNLITLLQAYKELDKSVRTTYKLVILGKKEGFITNDYKVFEFIKEHNLENDIYFTGCIKDQEVPIVYHQATMFIFPSLYEGFGLPILEAMSCAVPVLSSDRTSLPEIGGAASLYFDPSNFAELKEKITLLVNDKKLQSEMIKKGIEHVKNFSWEQSIQKHIKILNQLAKNA